jgi:sortase A
MSKIEVPQRDDLVIDLTTPPGDADAQTGDPATPSRRRRRLRPGLPASMLWVFAGVAGLALWFLVHALTLTAIEAHGSQSRLYAQFREKHADGTLPQGGRIEAGSPVALVDLGVDGLRRLVVVEGTSASQLTIGPGHLSNTPLPGQAGTAVLFGRSVTYGAPFRGIAKLHAGDTIKITTGQGYFAYRVDRIRRPGELLPPPFTPDTSRIILVTSEATGWRRGWAPQHMVFVDASLSHGTVQTAPGNRPTAVPRSALPMNGDVGALLWVVVWLAALLIVSTSLAWAWLRWGRRQTWIVGAPLALAVLWGASDAAIRLLPNLV